MATLKELVNETTTIKDELKTCHSNLKNSLVSKGINVTSSDKISNLISKVNNINTMPNCEAGDNHHLHYLELSERKTTSSFFLATNCVAFTNGGHRIKTLLSTQGGYGGTIRFEIVRNEVIIDSYERTVSNSTTVVTKDFESVEKNDNINIYFKTKSSWGELRNTFVSFNFI